MLSNILIDLGCIALIVAAMTTGNTIIIAITGGVLIVRGGMLIANVVNAI